MVRDSEDPALPGTVEVACEDANNYCRILTLLGMEEEGDPVAEVQRLVKFEDDELERRNRAALAWKTVDADGLPPCAGDTYIGINSAGFAACFTTVGDERECWMHTGEANFCVMSDLHWWRVLDRPHVDGVGSPDGEQR